jgi:hypothetical protein
MHCTPEYKLLRTQVLELCCNHSGQIEACSYQYAKVYMGAEAARSADSTGIGIVNSSLFQFEVIGLKVLFFCFQLAALPFCTLQLIKGSTVNALDLENNGRFSQSQEAALLLHTSSNAVHNRRHSYFLRQDCPCCGKLALLLVMFPLTLRQRQHPFQLVSNPSRHLAALFLWQSYQERCCIITKRIPVKGRTQRGILQVTHNHRCKQLGIVEYL